MCDSGGGGGGGDDGISEREAARQARIDAATKAVNELFGIGPRTAMSPTGEKRLTGYTMTTPGDEFTPATSRTVTPQEYETAQRTMTGRVMGIPVYGSGATYSPIYENIMTEKPTAAAAAADARARMYDTVRGDTRNFYSQQLNDDREKAAREMRFRLARAGTAGSSQAIDMGRDFTKANDRGLLDVANRADSAASNVRSSDEQSRLGLISKIVAGMDQGSAMSSALSQLQTNADIERQNSMAGRMENMFADLFGTYNNGQIASGVSDARRAYGGGLGNYFGNGRSENGRIS